MSQIFLSVAFLLVTLNSKAAMPNCYDILELTPAKLTNEFLVTAIEEIISLKHPYVQRWLELNSSPSDQRSIVQFCTGQQELAKLIQGWQDLSSYDRNQRVESFLNNLPVTPLPHQMEQHLLALQMEEYLREGLTPELQSMEARTKISLLLRQIKTRPRLKDQLQNRLFESLPSLTRRARLFEQMYLSYEKALTRSTAPDASIGRHFSRLKSQILPYAMAKLTTLPTKAASQSESALEQVEAEWELNSRTSLGVYIVHQYINQKKFVGEGLRLPYVLAAIDEILDALKGHISSEDFLEVALLILKHDRIPGLGPLTDYHRTQELVNMLESKSGDFGLTQSQQMKLSNAAQSRINHIYKQWGLEE